MEDEQFGFGFSGDRDTGRTEPDPAAVREDALAILEEAHRAASEPLWDAADLRHRRLIFPHLVSWLPREEAAQLCLEFEQRARRVELMLAA